MARQADYWWGPKGTVRLLTVLLLGATGLRCALGWESDDQASNATFAALHHLPGVLVEFLLGALAWNVSTRPLSKSLQLAAAMLGLAGWWVLATRYGLAGDAGGLTGATQGLLGAGVALCLALLVAGTAQRSVLEAPAPTRSIWHWLALWAGRLSYGVFLFHLAALRLAEGLAAGWSFGATRTLAMALTLAMATAACLVWENPWRLFGRRWAARLSR